MRPAEFIKKYKWHLTASLLVYFILTLLLFCSTDTSQDVPFLDQVF